MEMKKKVLVGVLSVIGVLLICVAVYVGVMLSRVKYVSLDEADKNAEKAYQELLKEQEAQKQAEPAPSLEPSNSSQPSISPQPTLDPDEDLLEFQPYNPEDKNDIIHEVHQTELTAMEKAIMEETAKRGDVFNILLIGVDRRGTEGASRSDSMMIATVDAKNKRLKLTSIMRDLYVPIPKKGSNRINAACTAGGPGLVMKTINENFDTDIEYYVLVDFKMFENIVDKLGGIELTLSRGEVSEANDCIAGLNKQRKDPLRDGFIKQREGDMILDGKQALGYCRMRHFGDGDYARTSRQAKALQVLLDKFFDSDPVKQTQILYDVFPLIETNLSSTQILSISSQVVTMGSRDIMHYRLPVQGDYKVSTVRGMWVLVPDIKSNAKALHEFLYNATEVEPLKGSDTGGGSGKVSTKKKAEVTEKPTSSPTPTTSQSIAEPTPEAASEPKNTDTPDSQSVNENSDNGASEKAQEKETAGSNNAKGLEESTQSEKAADDVKTTKGDAEEKTTKSNAVPRPRKKIAPAPKVEKKTPVIPDETIYIPEE